jgi:hypothetical protein
MALAPADFYAYSRATGVPVPESPEERIALVPEVLEFRRNQLTQPKEGTDLGQLIGSAALGAGALAGLGFAARRLLGRGTQVPKGPSVSATSPVRTVDLQEFAARATSPVTRAASQEAREAIAGPPPSKIATPGPVEVEFEAYRPDPKEFISRQVAEARRNAATESLLQAAEARRGTYQTSIPGVPATLMELRSKELGIDPAAAGLFQGEAPSYPLSQAPKQFSIFNSLTEAQNSTLPSQVTQAVNAVESGTGQITGRVRHEIQRDEDLDIASATQERILDPITAQEQLELAKQEMISRRQQLEAAGFRPGTTRFERALAQPFRTSASTQVTGTKPIDFALPEGVIRGTVESVSASEPLPERSVLNIGPQAVVTSTAAGTAIRGTSPSYHEALPKQGLRQLFGTADRSVPGAPDELTMDIPGGLRIRGGLVPDAPPELLSKQEIKYSVLDRPAAVQPEGGSAGIGIYGVEPGYVPGAVGKATGEYSEAASRKPTYVPGWLQKKQMAGGFGALTSSQLASAAEKAKGPRIQSAIEAEVGRRRTAEESLAVSEVLRKARIEGRDPQTLLRSKLAELGVSAVGDFSPYPRRR